MSDGPLRASRENIRGANGRPATRYTVDCGCVVTEYDSGLNLPFERQIQPCEQHTSFSFIDEPGHILVFERIPK